MRLSRTEEYGLRCLVQLARVAPEQLGIRELAACEGISHDNAARHLRLLRLSGLIDSRLGRQGGYRLSRPAGSITVWDALNALRRAGGAERAEQDGAGPAFRIPEPGFNSVGASSLRSLWNQLSDANRSLLEQVTLADLLPSDQVLRLELAPTVSLLAHPGDLTRTGTGQQADSDGAEPMTRIDQPTHVIAVVGGSSAGSTVAEVLADRGCEVVVFDQNPRPYGKIEDGLPRWHVKHRNREYGEIDIRLDRPGVTFVPSTRLGGDLDFLELARGWGFSAVVLANGAWRDRPLAVPGAAAATVDGGLVYQNAFIHWFNHEHEASYSGSRYEIPDGTVVVGGGLASIDVMKIIQIRLYQRALAEQGIEVGMLELEKKGIPKVCVEHGITDPYSLGVNGGLLVYRRTVEEMPLASTAVDAPQAAKDRLPRIRQRVLDKVMKKYLFRFQPQTVPAEVELRNGRVSGLLVRRTEERDGRLVEVEGSEQTLKTPLIISSIGSLPEPVEGIEMDGAYYRFEDWDTGRYGPIPTVFGAGNVITGQGNIRVSNKHGRYVGEALAERYLGIADEDAGRAFEAGPSRGVENAAKNAGTIAAALTDIPKLSPAAANRVLTKALARQYKVGFKTSYRKWILQHSAPD
jgi:ferredoxin/flavodoxin---NADP+ reductase